MADETTVEDEVTEDVTEADDTPETDDEILGATPAEEAPEPEPVVTDEDDVRAQIAALLDKGYTLPQLEVTTNAKGTPIAVKVA